MKRRSFIKGLLFGIGAIYTATATGIDLFAKKVGLKKVQPFPTWDVKWKLTGKKGWKYKSQMHLPEGVNPPAFAKRHGVDYDLFRANPLKHEAVYFRRASGTLYREPDGLSPAYGSGMFPQPKVSENVAIGYTGEDSMMPDFDPPSKFPTPSFLGED